MKRLRIITAETLAGIPWLVHGFSTRPGGVSEAYGGQALNLGITREDTRAAVEKNRELFFQALGACGDQRPGSRVQDPPHTDARQTVWPMVAMRQVHSSVIHRVGHPDQCQQAPTVGRPGQERADVGHHPVFTGDGLITDKPGIVLSVRVADCQPVLIADPKKRAVGAIHAGWRGTLARIVDKGVGEMRRQFGSDPADLRVAIGPGIHRCCYEVGEEVFEQFASQFSYAAELFEEVASSDPVRRKYPLLFMNMRAPGHGEPPRALHLDLPEANRRQLMEAGVLPENIWISELCTSCRTDLLFSHRREKGVTGRMMGAIGISD